MTEDFSHAHRRLDRILGFFLVVCVAGLSVGIVNNDWSFAAVWLVAGFLNGVIGFAVRERGRMPPTSADNEAADERLLAGSITSFSSLVAGSIFVLGFVMRQPWWAVLIATAVGWFAKLFQLATSRINSVFLGQAKANGGFASAIPGTGETAPPGRRRPGPACRPGISQTSPFRFLRIGPRVSCCAL